MKQLFQMGGLLIFLTFLTTSLSAQKFGYMNSTAILSAMPEVKQAESTIEVTKKQYQEKGKKMVEDLQTKYQEVQKKQQEGTLSPKQLDEESNKLRVQEEEIAKLEQDMTANLQKKQAELMQPILDKVNKAIQETAKENGFQFVFDASPGSGIILYADENLDITPLVMTKMGIQANSSN